HSNQTYLSKSPRFLCSISKPRNMLMKAFLLGVLGYFMTIIVWQTFTTHAGTLLEVFVSPKKIDRIYTIPLFQNLGFFYPIICGVFFFVFEKKTKPSLALYNLLSGAIGVATEFGVRKKNNQDTIEEVVNELNSQSGIPIGDVIHPIHRKLTLSWRDIIIFIFSVSLVLVSQFFFETSTQNKL
ncbi:MAG TPA: hypothetical protein PLU50_12155, partial [Pseudobdellovibrionaceae bacterium]|nr:hypothetical protein [Pseudobdellovibrionaceae bacterium]